MLQVDIDWSSVADFGKAFEQAPQELLKAVAQAFRNMGKSDIDKLKKEQLSGGGGHLKIRRKGLVNAFKQKVKEGKDFSQLTLDEYTGWKAFKIWETGGTITPRTKRLLTVLTDKARDSSGKRKYTQKQLQGMIQSGELRMVRSKKIVLIVKNVGVRNKSGGFRKNSRNDIIAFLVPKVHLKKMLDFYGNFARNESEHQRYLDNAAGEALGKFSDDDKTQGGGGK